MKNEKCKLKNVKWKMENICAAVLRSIGFVEFIELLESIELLGFVRLLGFIGLLRFPNTLCAMLYALCDI
jgi:hypothetical protein